MPVHNVTDNIRKIIETMSMDNLDKCARCGKVYLLVLFKEGENYNDFGDRYCPFCGLHTEAFCFAVNNSRFFEIT